MGAEFGSRSHLHTDSTHLADELSFDPMWALDVHPALSRHALAQLCKCEVVLLADKAGHQRQCLSVEQATPAAGMGRSGKPAGQPSPAQHLLDKGHADAELPGELTPRGRALVAGLCNLGT
jgi:hypothetical protein